MAFRARRKDGKCVVVSVDTNGNDVGVVVEVGGIEVVNGTGYTAHEHESQCCIFTAERQLINGNQESVRPLELVARQDVTV